MPDLKTRLFHTWFLLTRPMTLGVRALAFDAEGRILLVRHTYIRGWHLPGGGVESGQTMPSLLTLYRIANALDISPSAPLPADPDPEVVHVSGAADATWVPVSEASDTAHTRVIHAGETSLQEYAIRPGEQVGDWFETDGEVIHYVIEGAIALEIEGLGIWELGAGDAVGQLLGVGIQESASVSDDRWADLVAPVAPIEIDNPNLLRGGDIAALDWLATAEAEHAEFRADRFLAAVNWRSDRPLRLAYIVRAVSPGTFHHPAASVEDMYRPQYRARTETGQVSIAP